MKLYEIIRRLKSEIPDLRVSDIFMTYCTKRIFRYTDRLNLVLETDEKATIMTYFYNNNKLNNNEFNYARNKLK